MASLKKCALCIKRKELKNSHIIPYAFFHRILKNNQGRAIQYIDDPISNVEYTSNSWSEDLCCDLCERKMNEEYE
jgi:hypothetical protein